MTVLKKPIFSTFKSLTHDQMVAVEVMMAKGDSIPSIARTLQDDWKLLKDKNYPAVVKALQRYKAQVVKGRLVKHTTTISIEKVDGVEVQRVSKIREERLFDDFDTKVDTFEALTSLINMQTGRVNKLFQTEMKMKVGILNQCTTEIKTLSRLLVQMTNLQLETGVLSRAPTKLAGEVAIFSELAASQEGTLNKDKERAGIELDVTHRVFDMLGVLRGAMHGDSKNIN